MHMLASAPTPSPGAAGSLEAGCLASTGALGICPPTEGDTLVAQRCLLASVWGGFRSLLNCIHGGNGEGGLLGSVCGVVGPRRNPAKTASGATLAAARDTEIGRDDHCGYSEATAVAAMGARSRGRCRPSGPLSAAGMAARKKPPWVERPVQLVHWSVRCFM